MAVGQLLATVLLPGALVAPAAAAPPAKSPPCDTKPGGAPGEFWAQGRLNFRRAWSVTKGAGVVVGVVDTGLNTTNGPAVLHRIQVKLGTDVIPGYRRDFTADCDGHGSAVTAIIAGQESDTDMIGVAPEASIVVVKQTNKFDDDTGTAATIGVGIDKAIDAGAKVINVSITTSASNDPTLVAAVRRAASRGVVIVAAAGNDGQNQNLPAFPAAYAPKYPNVIAVSASDQQDQIANFSESGSYVTVAAPGVGIYGPAALLGYRKLDGTSFAAPFVTGTVALVLAANPGMSPEQVRNRITATADAPPASVPDRRYGYGIVNPFLAVSSIRDDVAAPPTVKARAPLPAPQPLTVPDRHLQHLALASATTLLAVAAIVIAGAGVLRARNSPTRRRSSSA